MASTPLRVADVLRTYGEAFLADHPVDAHHRRVIHHLLDCRTAALGGHLYECEHCGRQVPLYNSCRDRHCPTCQTTRKQQWLEDRQQELLPVPYFHVVFTLPHQLNALVRLNQPRLLGEFFGTVNWVLSHFGADPQWKLAGQLGFVAVLHTWTQKLTLHYHIHCLVPGGAWDASTRTWRSAHRNYLFSKDALAKAFCARFLKRIDRLNHRGRLLMPDPSPNYLQRLIGSLRSQSWIVYPKATAASADQALDYLGRYTHRVAISDHRILSLDNGQICFLYRDRRDGNARKQCTLPAKEFIRRFLLHVLPPSFRKIRYYGWLAPTRRAQSLPAIRDALGTPPPPPPPEETTAERIHRLTGIDVRLCPHCQHPALTYAGTLPRLGPRGPPS